MNEISEGSLLVYFDLDELNKFYAGKTLKTSSKFDKTVLVYSSNGKEELVNKAQIIKVVEV